MTGLAGLALLAAACGTNGTTPTMGPGPVARFDFIRDDAGLLSAYDAEAAEEQLRDIATRSGVFGVVLTAPADRAVDPAMFRPVIAEVTAIGGEALITICTPDSCGLDASLAHTDRLAEAVSAVQPRHAPPPTGPADPSFGLHRWVEFVAEVATWEGQ